MDDAGLLTPKDTKALMKPFITAMKQHRVWAREPKALDFGALIHSHSGTDSIYH